MTQQGDEPAIEDTLAFWKELQAEAAIVNVAEVEGDEGELEMIIDSHKMLARILQLLIAVGKVKTGDVMSAAMLARSLP